MFPILLAFVVSASPSISLQFEGPLKAGLKAVADKGGLNVIVVGNLDEPAQIHLAGVSAEEALETVAKVYQLEVTKQGKLYVLRRVAGSAETPVSPAIPTPPTPPSPPMALSGSGSKDSSIETLEAEMKKLAAEQRRLERLSDTLESKAGLGASQLEKEARRIEQELEAKEAEIEARAEALEAQVEAEAEKALAEAEAEAEAAEADAEALKDSRDSTSRGAPLVVEASKPVQNAVAYGGPVIVERGARVFGDAVAFGGDVVVKDKAHIGGDAVSFGGRVIREGSAKIGGEEVSFGGSGLATSMATHAVKATRAVEKKSDDEPSGLSIAGFLVRFVVMFVFGFLLMVFAPQRMKGLETAIRNQPAVSGAIGLLAFLGLVPVTVFLLVTIIGIPVAALMWLAMTFVVPMGLAAIANTIGSMVPLGRVRRTQALVLAVGILVLLLSSHVPFLGPLLFSVAACVGLGAVVRTRVGSMPKGLPVAESAEQLGV
jgi:hypothetical protein